MSDSHAVTFDRGDIAHTMLVQVGDILGDAGLMLFVLDARNEMSPCIAYASSYAHRRLEYPNDELTGSLVFQVDVSIRNPEVMQAMQQNYEAQSWVTTENRYRTRGGSEFDVSVTISRGSNEVSVVLPPNYVLAIARDISHRKHLERDLTRSLSNQTEMAAIISALAAKTELHSGDVPGFANAVCEAMLRFDAFSDATVFLVNQEGSFAYPVGMASRRMSDLLAAGLNEDFPLSNYPDYSEASLSGKCLFSSDVASMPVYGDFYHDVLLPLQVLALADVPILVDGSVLGNLTIASISEHVEWNESWQSFLQSVAQLMGQCCLAQQQFRQAIEVERSERLLTDAQELSGLGSWRVDLETNVLWWSAACYSLLGEDPAEFVPTISAYLERLHPDDFGNYQSGWQATLAGSERHYVCEYRVRHRDGGWRWFRERGRLVRAPDGLAASIWGCSQDVTEDHEHHLQVQTLLTQDRLTGLLSRFGLEQMLNADWPLVAAGQKALSLVLIDLAEFSSINLALGQAVGDEVLRLAAQRIRNSIAPLPAARLSGDVFAVPVPSIDRQEVNAKILELLKQLEVPVDVGGAQVSLSASVGIAIAPVHGRTFVQIVSAAELALSQAKTRSPRAPLLFREEFRQQAASRFKLVHDIREGIGLDEFSIHYQPILRSTDRALVGAEALLRWSRQGRYISPQEFIPVAEVAGLIDELGELVVDKVTRQIFAWRQSGFSVPRISLNVSPHQIANGRILPWLDQCLERCNLDAGSIAIEITESGTVANVEASREFINALKQRNIAAYIDDFGTGLSSLQYLAELPLTTLKIDRAFIEHLASTHGNYGALVVGIIRMAHEIGLSVVAEGVEDDKQFEFLAESGCDFIQGYLTGRPVPADQFQSLLTVPLLRRQAF